MRRKKLGGQQTNVAVKEEKKKLATTINSEKLEIEKIDKELEDKKITLKNRSQELIDLDKKVDKIRQDVLKENDRLVIVQKAITVATGDLEKVKLEIKNVKDIRDEMMDQERTTSALQIQEQQLLKKKAEIEARIEEALVIEDSILKRIEKFKKDLEDLEVLSKNLDEQVLSQKKQLLDLENEIDQKKKKEAEDYGKRIADWKKAEEIVKSNIDSLNGDLVKKNKELKDLEEEKQKRLAPINKKENELKARETALVQKESAFNEKETRVNTLAKTLQKHFDKMKMPIKVIE